MKPAGGVLPTATSFEAPKSGFAPREAHLFEGTMRASMDVLALSSSDLANEVIAHAAVLVIL
jgi:hypothetical protein